MKKFVAMLAVLATAGLLAACQPGKPIEGGAAEGHMMSAEKTDVQTEAAPAATGKSGRTFEGQ
ncbi:MAG: hypothetical protein EBQ96_04645 [Proteobacteria bacterium]|nr:hypothetical protein [Pseudomonadota bacterium]